MLELYSNGLKLDIDENISIPIVLTNPMFNATGSRSYTFTLPISSKINCDLFGINRKPGYFERKALNLPVDVIFNKMKMLSGYLKIQNITELSIECYLLADNGSFNDWAAANSLRDIGLSDTDFSNVDDYNDYCLDVWENSAYPDYEFAIPPVRNEQVNLNSFSDDVQWFNRIWEFTDEEFPQLIEPVNIKHMNAMVYVMHLFDLIFLSSGYKITHNAWKKIEDFKKLILYTPNLNWCDPFYTTSGWSIDLNESVPDKPIIDFISFFTRLTNSCLFIDSKLLTIDIYFLNDIINQKTAITDLSGCLYKLTRGNYEELAEGYKFTLTPDAGDEHMVLNDYQNRAISGTVAEFEDLADVADPEPGMLILVTEDDSYYEYAGDDPDEPKTLEEIWPLFSRKVMPLFRSGDESFTVETQGHTISMSKRGYYSYYFEELVLIVLAPHVDQLFNNPKIFKEENDFDFRLLIYHGQQPGYLGIDMPLASNDVYDYDGDKISGADHSLKFDGIYGLYQNFFENYIYWYNTIRQEFTATINLTPELLGRLKFHERYMINNMSFLINTIEFNLTRKSIKDAKLTLYAL